MNLRILQIGKTKETWLKQGIGEYLKRLAPLIKLEIVEIADASIKQAANSSEVKSREALSCLKRISPDDYVILLDEHGVEKTSLEFSAFLTNLSDKKYVDFVIGGVFGVDDLLRKRADEFISLSTMTFTHQMVRLILVEQIYRALMIQNNRNYHY